MNLDQLRSRLFIDVPTAAREVFGVDERTVRRGIADGQLPAVRVGNRTLLPVPALLRLLGVEDHAEYHGPAEPGIDAGQGAAAGGPRILRLHGGGAA